MVVLRFFVLALGVVGCAALVLNEQRLARDLAAVDETRARLVEGGPPGPGSPLVARGQARAAAPALDPDFELRVEGLRLDRVAETLQWRERKEGSGDNKTLRYETFWSGERIRSERFERRGHANPDPLPLANRSWPADDVRLASFRVGPEVLEAFPAGSGAEPGRAVATSVAGRTFTEAGGWLVSGDQRAPRVGDVRVRWRVVAPGPYTIIAADEEGELVPFRPSSGLPVVLAAAGDVDPAELLGAASRARQGEAWTVRAYGAGALVIIGLISTPLWRGERRGALRLAARALLGGLATATAAVATGWLLFRGLRLPS